MTVSSPYQNLLGPIANVSAVERTSKEFYPHPGAKDVDLLIFSADAGNIDVDVRMSDGQWREISTTAVVANTLLRVPVPIRSAPCRARFTPSAATGTVVIDGAYSGHGGSVA